jgi:hypothetical protein
MGARQDSPRYSTARSGSSSDGICLSRESCQDGRHDGRARPRQPPGERVLAYSRSRAIRQKQWDVRLFDVETKTHLAVPEGINTTSKREGRPSISGDYLLFERGPQRWGAGTKIVLYRFSTSSSTIIGTAPDVGWLSVGQVSGG